MRNQGEKGRVFDQHLVFIHNHQTFLPGLFNKLPFFFPLGAFVITLLRVTHKM